MDPAAVFDYISANVNNSLIPKLMEFVAIPSLSTDYDKDWESNGLMLQAMNKLIEYVDSLAIAGLTHEVLKEPGKPWLFYGTLPASDPSLPTVLMYGHFDKQPHMGAWSEGLGPTTPVIRGDRLYGRGASDDGYAVPSSALIMKALQNFNIPHGKIIILGENEEESDSTSLVYYVNLLKPRMGKVDIVVCLDSGILSYDRLWLTTSLRGVFAVNLTVQTLKIGFHSGGGSGIMPSTFRVLQMLLERVEDPATGRILLPELHAHLTPNIYIDKARTAEAIGDSLLGILPFADGVQPMSDDVTKLLIANAYEPTLVVTGLEGLPQIKDAGNVLHPAITARLSFRLPPGVNAERAMDAVTKELLRDPPYNAKVTATTSTADNGWAQKPVSQKLDRALDAASLAYFQKGYLTLGEGGSIPFMGFLGESFPEAEFIITGVLGVDSNAHSIDENLDIPYLKKTICCLVEVFSRLGNKSN
jgi:acetylornithine deacetylase/succinyl-diaminopimelate desuccinylase-like protein